MRRINDPNQDNQSQVNDYHNKLLQLYNSRSNIVDMNTRGGKKLQEWQYAYEKPKMKQSSAALLKELKNNNSRGIEEVNMALLGNDPDAYKIINGGSRTGGRKMRTLPFKPVGAIPQEDLGYGDVVSEYYVAGSSTGGSLVGDKEPKEKKGRKPNLYLKFAKFMRGKLAGDQSFMSLSASAKISHIANLWDQYKQGSLSKELIDEFNKYVESETSTPVTSNVRNASASEEKKEIKKKVKLQTKRDNYYKERINTAKNFVKELNAKAEIPKRQLNRIEHILKNLDSISTEELKLVRTELPTLAKKTGMKKETIIDLDNTIKDELKKRDVQDYDIISPEEWVKMMEQGYVERNIQGHDIISPADWAKMMEQGYVETETWPQIDRRLLRSAPDVYGWDSTNGHSKQDELKNNNLLEGYFADTINSDFMDNQRRDNLENIYANRPGSIEDFRNASQLETDIMLHNAANRELESAGEVNPLVSGKVQNDRLLELQKLSNLTSQQIADLLYDSGYSGRDVANIMKNRLIAERMRLSKPTGYTHDIDIERRPIPITSPYDYYSNRRFERDRYLNNVKKITNIINGKREPGIMPESEADIKVAITNIKREGKEKGLDKNEIDKRINEAKDNLIKQEVEEFGEGMRRTRKRVTKKTTAKKGRGKKTAAKKSKKTAAKKSSGRPRGRPRKS